MPAFASVMRGGKGLHCCITAASAWSSPGRIPQLCDWLWKIFGEADSGRQWNDAEADQAGLAAGGEAKEEERGKCRGDRNIGVASSGGRWKELTEGTHLPRLEKGPHTSVQAGFYRRNQVGRYTADVPGNLVNRLVPTALLRKGESSVKKCKEGIGGKQRIPNKRPDANPQSARRPHSPCVNLPCCKWWRKGAGMHTGRFTTMLIG